MERLKRFGITHPATFARVLADNPDTARKVLNLILGSEIDKLVCTNAEEVVGLWPGNDIKSVRFDVTFKGDRDQKHYVIELQNQIEEFLPQRMRLYQAMLTTEKCIKRGEEYDSLRASTIIWITNYDPFGKGLGIYTFLTKCDEDSELTFKGKPFFDGGLTRLVNLKGNFEGYKPEVSVLAKYLRGGAAQKTGLTAELEQKVDLVNQDLEWRRKLMELESYYYRLKRNTAYEARMKGIEFGRSEGIAQGIQQERLEGRKREREMILSLLKKNVAEPIILDACHLTKEELDEIRNSCR